jgi:hypothetical protein
MAAALQALLLEERQTITPVDLDTKEEEAVRKREIQVGDVFAAKLKLPPGGGGRGGRRAPGGGPGGGGTSPRGGPENPGAWLDAPIVDITVTAVEAAKSQASAAASGAADENYLAVIAREMNDDEGGPDDTTPTPAVPLPSDSSSGGGGAAAVPDTPDEVMHASAGSQEATVEGTSASEEVEIVQDPERLRHHLQQPVWHEADEGAAVVEEESLEFGPGETAGA